MFLLTIHFHKQKHYGRDRPEAVKVVKQIYNDLNISKIFRDYEEESYQTLKESISGIKMVPQLVFLNLLARIYKRNV